MDGQNTSLRNRTYGGLESCLESDFERLSLVSAIVREGFTPEAFLVFQEQYGRPPLPHELASPSHLVVDLDTRQRGLKENPELRMLYPALGVNLSQDPDFYSRRCPNWLHFLAAQNKKTLAQVVEQSIREVEENKENTSPRKDYMFGLKVWATSPRKYQRPENVAANELTEQQGSQKLYVGYLDWSRLSFEEAVNAFRAFYELLSGKRLEVHHNEKQLHQKADQLEDAVSQVYHQRAIAKIDSPQVNIYLKPNSSYHLRVDILGTKEEIMAFTGKVEKVMRETYDLEKAKIGLV